MLPLKKSVFLFFLMVCVYADQLCAEWNDHNRSYGIYNDKDQLRDFFGTVDGNPRPKYREISELDLIADQEDRVYTYSIGDEIVNNGGKKTLFLIGVEGATPLIDINYFLYSSVGEAVLDTAYAYEIIKQGISFRLGDNRITWYGKNEISFYLGDFQSVTLKYSSSCQSLVYKYEFESFHDLWKTGIIKPIRSTIRFGTRPITFMFEF